MANLKDIRDRIKSLTLESSVKKTRNGVNLTKIIMCPNCNSEQFVFYDQTFSCSSCNQTNDIVANQTPILLDRTIHWIS